MKLSINKRQGIRIISFCLAVSLASTGLIVKFHRKNKYFERKISNSYSKSIEELSEGLKSIDVALQKSLYASTATQFSILASELTTQAQTSKDALANLPLQNADLTTVNKFLSQVGNYTLFLSKKLISGEDVTAEERKLLAELKSTSDSLATAIDEARLSYSSEDGWLDELNEKISDTEISDSLSVKLSEIEESLVDYPTLVYDGPFADNIYTKESKMCENANEITESDALKKAQEILPRSNLSFDSMESGKIEGYIFTDENTTVTVSKKGGYIVYFRKYREINESNISYESAVEIAREYLNQNGSFVESYYFAEENMCVVSFVHKEGNTICYPDMVKVGVALDDGEILMLESRSFLMNHHTRTIPVPQKSEGEAKSVLSDNLSVISSKKVIISTTGKNEKLCYEFYCKGENDEELLIYINAANLQEENILLLLKTDGGTLTK